MCHECLDGAVVGLAVDFLGGQYRPMYIVPAIDIADGYGGAGGFVPQIAFNDERVGCRVGFEASVCLVAGEDFGPFAVAVPDIALIIGFGYFCYSLYSVHNGLLSLVAVPVKMPLPRLVMPPRGSSPVQMSWRLCSKAFSMSSSARALFST